MSAFRSAVNANTWARLAVGGFVVAVAVVVLVALGSQSGHSKLSQSQLREFGPVCASDGRIVSVRKVNRGGARLWRVRCSGGLVTDVAR